MDHKALAALMALKKQSMKKFERTAKFQPGKNRIRVLQGWRKGEEHVWYHDFGQHFIKDAADAIQAVYLCTANTFGTPCDVCSALVTAGRSVTDDETQKTLAKAKASKVILINALMLDSNEPNTPVILELKASCFTQLLEILEEWGPEAFFDETKGHEIVVNRDGKGLNTTYTAGMTPKEYKVPPASMTRLNNLDDYVKQESPEQQLRAIAAVNSVAGFLPAPSAADRPRTAVGTSAPVGRIAAPIEFDDVPDTAPPAATPAARNDVALDEELDSLLGDLDSAAVTATAP